MSENIVNIYTTSSLDPIPPPFTIVKNGVEYTIVTIHRDDTSDSL